MADLSLGRQTGAVPSVICDECGEERVVVTDYGSWFVKAHDHNAPAEPVETTATTETGDAGADATEETP